MLRKPRCRSLTPSTMLSPVCQRFTYKKTSRVLTIIIDEPMYAKSEVNGKNYDEGGVEHVPHLVASLSGHRPGKMRFRLTLAT